MLGGWLVHGSRFAFAVGCAGGWFAWGGFRWGGSVLVKEKLVGHRFERGGRCHDAESMPEWGDHTRELIEIARVDTEIWKSLMSILQHTDACNRPQIHDQIPDKNTRREDV
jgi:hypothetical protein